MGEPGTSHRQRGRILQSGTRPAANSTSDAGTTTGVMSGHNAERVTYLDTETPRLSLLIRDGRTHQCRGGRFLCHQRPRTTTAGRIPDHPCAEPTNTPNSKPNSTASTNFCRHANTLAIRLVHAAEPTTPRHAGTLIRHSDQSTTTLAKAVLRAFAPLAGQATRGYFFFFMLTNIAATPSMTATMSTMMPIREVVVTCRLYCRWSGNRRR